MELIHLIIDKVSDVFVFNLIEGSSPSRYLHYQVRTSRHFIDEFIKEINNLNHLVLSLHKVETETSIQIINKLKVVSETFFLEFFPEEIIKKVQTMQQGYLFFHLDSSLSHIPWELLYDGTSFLGDKFRIGRSIQGSWKEKQRIDKTKLKILIITNPSGDLLEAEEEGTILFDTLNSEIPSDVIELQMFTGNRVTKLKLLSELQNFDILHYAGHVIYDKNEPSGGMLLSNHEILLGREIQRLSKTPALVFLNACRSAIAESNIGLAYSFLKAGVINYIGTNWNIPDAKQTIEFAVNFYRFLFDEKTIGDALFESRKYSRESNEIHNLLWASYSLYGNPSIKFFKTPEKKTYEAIRTDWNLKKILNEFPTFVSLPYRDFTIEKEDTFHLFICFKRLIITVAGIIIESYKKLDLKLTDIFEDASQNHPIEDKKEDYKNFNQLLETCLVYSKRIHLINFQIPILPLVKSFLLHYDDIQRMLKISEDFFYKKREKELSKEETETITISFQYLLENLFIDFSILSRTQFFYNNGTQFPCILFKGLEEKPYHILPIFKEDELLKTFLERHVGEVCMMIDDFYLSLKHYIEYEPISKTYIFEFL